MQPPLDLPCRAAAQFNPAHALDAAMSFSLHIGRYWRGASDVHCSAITKVQITQL
jgi:hypothetical protein